jgi:hypothetical protein
MMRRVVGWSRRVYFVGVGAGREFGSEDSVKGMLVI